MAIKKVVGLSYNADDGLPRVILKASGEMAQQVEQEFGRHKPAHRLIEDEALATSLFRLPLESDISPDLYQLVALLLVHVYSVEAKLKDILKND